ncbi:MAG: ribonuclease P protein component [Pseudonocardiales bacterium]
MLPAAARLRRREDFRTTLRHGRRTTRGCLALALLSAEDEGRAAEASPLVGLVVGRGVGGAVTRNLVSRRLRHLVRPRLAELPPGSRLVVRALPTAGGASHATLQRDLDAALKRLVPASP